MKCPHCNQEVDIPPLESLRNYISENYERCQKSYVRAQKLKPTNMDNDREKRRLDNYTKNKKTKMELWKSWLRVIEEKQLVK